MIFHIPHSSKVFPEEHRSVFVLDNHQLNNELIAITDAYTDEIFGAYAKDTDTVIIFPISRLIVDPERFLNDKEEVMANIGMGVIYTNTSNGDILRKMPSKAERKSLIRKYYQPHHEHLANTVRNDLDRQGKALILDCHSFPSSPLPYELDQNPDRPDICIGTDMFHTSHDLYQTLRESVYEVGWRCTRNRPFSGTIVPLEFYKKDSRVESIMIEVNRRLYMDESTGLKSPLFEHFKESFRVIISSLRSYEYPK